MMKKYFICVVAGLLSSVAVAQDNLSEQTNQVDKVATTAAKPTQKVRYQAEIIVGYNFGLIKEAYFNSVDIHTIHGIRVGQYFSTGVGIGLEFMDRIPSSQRSRSAGVYANLPLYRLNGQKVG